MSESKKSDLDMRDKAMLHQQRRLKQATQFTHKDSADLLPLDGLKRLGTSKDLQPHSIVQRRLLEGNIMRLRGEGRDPSARVRSPLADSKEGGEMEERSESTADDSTEERESPEESERSLRSEEDNDDDEEEDEEERKESGIKAGTDLAEQKQGCSKTEEERQKKEGMEERVKPSSLTALIVQCKCRDAEMKVSINTGCQHNHVSRSCCRRLGLKPALEVSSIGQTKGQSQRLDTPVGSLVEGLQLQMGKERVQCSARVTDDDVFELCLGLQTLLELKCCVDLGSRVLRLQGSGEELPFLETSAYSQCHHDNNKNL
ncbi:nuclear receptor-interacting protein 2 [Denticeps clupeoides]|uniref:Aspartic peptidase DDI1-type domain-containing protein n=1 Tax=Denticeps clupeoides TaxID=299321 RepID=A0AAY4C071_9TELE|nr:nuclear receptor-interacting protein 3-like [Denticeps clupeoides]